MRLCYLCADRGISLAKTNGSAAHVRNMVKAFAGLGHEVVLVMASPDGAEDLGVPVHGLPVAETYDRLRSAVRKGAAPARLADGRDSTRVVSALGHLWQNIAVEQVLDEVLDRYRPDVVYERYSPFCAAGVLKAARAGYPHILEVNAPLAWQGAKYRDQALNEAAELLEGVAFAKTTRIRAISEELRDDLVSAGLPADKVAVVPCGVDTLAFSPDVEPFRDGLEGKFVIGFVGSLKPWHGIDKLVDAFKQLADQPAFHLLIVGDGPEGGIIDALGRDLPGRVTHIRSVPGSEVPGYIKAMDMAVAPYPDLKRFFFSPLKVLESMAVGRPVVASRIGQIPWLVSDGESGVLVPPGDARALAEAARRLYAEPELGRRLGARAALEAHGRHAWSQRASDILKIAEATQ